MLGMIGLFGGLALLIYLTMKGMNLLIAAPLSALVRCTIKWLTIISGITG